MKKFRFYICLIILVPGALSCSIDENPRFFAGELVVTDLVGANAILNGAYSRAESAHSNAYPHMIMGTSGLFGINTLPLSSTIGSLVPLASESTLQGYWVGSYATIGQVNDLIANFLPVEIEDVDGKNNILGQAYFLRAWKYFDLVRLWGRVPLMIEPVSLDNMNLPRAAVSDIYEQIVADAEMAKSLLKPINNQDEGRPAAEAAHMLLAKVYMTLAGDQRHGETGYWQKAWDEAIQVYGKYSLVPDFSSLWYEETGDNTVESIFELQSNVNSAAGSRWERIFSATNSNAGRNMYGRIWANLEVYDRHVERYPGDPRIELTFVTSHPFFRPAGDQSIQTTYPLFLGRGNANKSYPRLFKYFVKDIYKDSYVNNKNVIIYRYADLLIMLAEIANEIDGPDAAYTYVNQVMERARKSGDGSPAATPADWFGMSQETFREAIMQEYQFELLGEGQEWFDVRRRGYQYFKTHVIDMHNNVALYGNFSANYDNEYPDNDRIMLLPIPSSELTSNPGMGTGDQNPGY